MDTPIIRIEMEGIRRTVMSHMAAKNHEYNEMVQQTLAATLNEKWVRESVQVAVNKTVQEVINNLGNDSNIKYAVSDVLSKALAQMISNNAPTPPTEEPK